LYHIVIISRDYWCTRCIRHCKLRFVLGFNYFSGRTTTVNTRLRGASQYAKYYCYHYAGIALAKTSLARQSDGTIRIVIYRVGVKYNNNFSRNRSSAGEKCDWSDDDARAGFFSAKDVIVGRVKTDKPVTPSRVVRGCARDFETRRAFSGNCDDGRR